MDDKTFADVFRNVFNTPDGKTVLYWILDQCGYFQQDPRLISPDLLAFAHRLLAVGAVTDVRKAGEYMTHIMAVSKVKSPMTRRDEYDDFLED